jgi:hypothetical protein
MITQKQCDTETLEALKQFFSILIEIEASDVSDV